jgi:MFS family permease
MSLVLTSSSKSSIRHLAAARLISLAGSEAAYISVFYVVYRRTNSAGMVSLAFLVTFGTLGVLTPIAGSLGDRFDRRRVMIASDLVGALCFAALAWARSPGLLILLAFFAAAVESPFVAASNAAVAALVEPDLLAWANGTIALGGNVGYLIGPALGGALLAAFGAGWVFLGNAVSFVFSAALVATMSGRFTSAGDAEREVHQGLRAGIRFLLGDRVLRTMVVGFVVFLVAVGSVLVAELPLSRSFGVGAFGYGLLSGSFGVGALVGALAARKLTDRVELRALVWCSMVTAVAVAAVAVVPWFPLILVVLAVAGTADGVVDVAYLGVLQRRTPDAVRSRVIGAFEGFSMLAFAASFIFAGVVVDALGPKNSYALAGGLALLTPAILAIGLAQRPPAVEEV